MCEKTWEYDTDINELVVISKRPYIERPNKKEKEFIAKVMNSFVQSGLSEEQFLELITPRTSLQSSSEPPV